MQIYINKNGEQHGPFEENAVYEMLRKGQLSPTDFGIKQGQNQWASLAEMFPAYPAISSSPQNPAVSAAVSPIERKRGGGFLRIFGAVLLVMGLFTAAAFYALPKVSPPVSCALASDDEKELERLKKEYEQAKGTPEEKTVKLRINSTLGGLETSTANCQRNLVIYTLLFVIALAVGIVGLIACSIGFLKGRRN